MNALTKEQLQLNKQYSRPDFGNTNTPYDTGAIQVSKISSSVGQTSPYKTANTPTPKNMPPSMVYDFNNK